MTKPESVASPPAAERRQLAVALVVVLVSLCAVELALRGALPETQLPWYEEHASAGPPIHHVFIGSSQVAAAVDAELVEELLGEGTTALNVGRGYSTTRQHRLGLDMLRRGRGLAPGCAVWLEMAGGVPSRDRIGGSWLHPEAPGLLISLLRRDDVVPLLRSELPIERKLGVVIHWAGRDIALIRHGRRVESRLRSAVLDLADRIAVALRIYESEATGGDVDLVAEGGIRTDRAGVETARLEARRYRDELLANLPSDVDWSRTEIAALVEDAKAAGCRAVAYEIPQHPLWQEVQREEAMRALRRSFATWAAEQGVSVVYPEIATTAEDFPDIWHLAASRRDDFTRALVHAYRSL